MSELDCVYPCNPGQQLTVDDRCEDCDMGTYKEWRNQTACVSCPIGFTTAVRGAKLKSQCDVLNCPPGTRIAPTIHPPINPESGYTKYCELCQIGFYQEQYNQTVCRECGKGDVTAGEGATSERDCHPGRNNQCAPDLPDTCPANYTCTLTDTGYQCRMGAETVESQPVTGTWQIWVGIFGAIVLLVILIIIVIVVFKIRYAYFRTIICRTRSLSL